MRLAWLVALAVACGPSGGARRPRHGDPHASRDAMVHEAFARLAAGDADGLVALADANEAFARGLRCESERGLGARLRLGELAKQLHADLRAAAGRDKGVAVEVIRIEPSRLELGKLVEEQGCTALVPSAHETLRVVIRAGGSERTVEMDLLDVGGRLYLVAVPRRLLPDPGAVKLAAAIASTANQVCACADLACATKLLEDFAHVRDEWLRTAKEKMDPHEAEQLRASTQTITACVEKLQKTR